MKASMHEAPRRNGEMGYRIRWREAGKQHSVSFDNFTDAERFRRNIEKFGPAKAMEIISLEDGRAAAGEATLKDACNRHIDHLTGIEPGTITRYLAYVKNDLTEIADLQLSTVTDTTVAAWIQWLEFEKGNSGKTIANKHGFLYAVLERAREDRKVDSNPCKKTRLPKKTHPKAPASPTPASTNPRRRPLWRGPGSAAPRTT